MATNASDQISKGTATGLFQFLDYLVIKGYAPEMTVKPWRNAARKVLESMEGDGYGAVSVLDINPDEYMDRFATKYRLEYKPDSLKAYRTRFRRAVDAYRSYLTEGNEWKPPSFKGTRTRSTSAKNATGSGTTVDIGTATETDTALPIASTPSTLLDYPFPLSTGDLAHLRLPRGLTPRDAERIGAFVKTLAFERESDSPARQADQ